MQRHREMAHSKVPVHYGECYIFTCPSCGGRKQVARLVMPVGVYNVWSDGFYEDTPVRCVSLLQQCPHCGGYYAVDLNDAPVEECTPLHDGRIRLEELETYLEQCDARGDSVPPELYMQYIHMYNDSFRRGGIELSKATHRQAMLFSKAILVVAALPVTPYNVSADLYRQAGMFRKCMDVAGEYSLPLKGEFLEILDRTRYFAIKGETEPFVMKSEELPWGRLNFPSRVRR